MHLVQRNRRRSLRRRIMSGDVDLEAIGVKRITVPKEYLEKMPLVTYLHSNIATKEDETPTPKSVSDENGAETSNNEIDKSGNTTIVPLASGPASSSKNATETGLSFSQSTCAICLDDFVSDETTVRELPCRHVFHPECVDGFLQKTSSLCPMCKKSVLPSGYCPPVITNAMVRRERFHRNPSRRPSGMADTAAEQMMSSVLRGHQIAHAQSRTTPASALASVITNPRTRTRSFTLGGALTGLPRRVSNALSRRESSAPTLSTVEMDRMLLRRAPIEQRRDPAETRRRRASAANRLAQAMAQGRTGEDDEIERQRRMPKCELCFCHFGTYDSNCFLC